MVRVKGTSYTTRSCSPRSTNPCYSSSNQCYAPPSCTSQRVIRTGPSYLSRSWFSHLCGTPYYSRPYSYFYNSRPSTTIIVDSPHETTATAQSREDRSSERTFAVIGLITFGIAVIAAIGISISRDCRYIETECTIPNWWGDRVCTPIYECKW